MLLKMRGGLDYIFVNILLGILIAAFAVWGIGPGILGGNQSVVATVGPVQIGANRYYRAVQTEATNLQQQFGGSLSVNDLITRLGLDQRVLNQMVAEAALAAEARRLGLRATEDQVIETLKSIEGLRGPDGSLNPALLRQILAANGLTEQELIEDIRRTSVRNQMLSSLVASSPIPGLYAEALYTYTGERRTGVLVNIGLDDVTVPDAPSDETLASFFESRKAEYKAPELRSYQYMLVTPEFYGQDIDVTQEDLEAEYRRRERDYNEPERRSVQQATLATLEDATRLVERVENGEPFADVAAELTSFTADEISLGTLEESDLVTDFDEQTARAVFALDAGEITAPLEGLAGYNVFRVTDVTPGTETPLADVRDEIADFVRADRAERALYDNLGVVEDALADDPVLAPIAERFGFTIASVSKVDVTTGQTLDGRAVVTSPDEARIMREASQLAAAAEPELFYLNPDDLSEGYFIVNVTEVTPEADRSLDEVRTRVLADWTEQTRRRQAGELAETVAARLRTGEAASDIVAELGGTSFDVRNLARTADEGSQVSANIRRLMFDLAEGAVDYDSAADNNGYVVAKVTEIAPGNPANEPAITDLKTELTNSFVGELLSQYQAYLLSEYPADVNRALISQLFDPTANAN